MTDFGDPQRLVVVGVDCSPQSPDVLQWADRQAQLTEARLLAFTSWHVDLPGVELVSAVDGLEGKTRTVLADAVVDALGRQRSPQALLQVSGRSPAEALVDKSRAADLLVVGPRSAHGIRGVLLGSVTERVLSHAACPVAVVHAAGRNGTGRIVVGLDGSAGSRRALDWAVRQAELTAATVEAIVAWEWTAQYGVYPYGPPSCRGRPSNSWNVNWRGSRASARRSCTAVCAGDTRLRCSSRHRPRLRPSSSGPTARVARPAACSARSARRWPAMRRCPSSSCTTTIRRCGRPEPCVPFPAAAVASWIR